ncbi:MAG: HAD family phosphatase [Thermomicrobiales bacterium]|nr:HAD family phosphatase [Thermomicrobiales bacterium]
MTTIDAVLFDMDGVLIDSEPVHFRMTVETLAHFGLPVPSEQEYDEFLFGRPDRDGFSDWLLRKHLDAPVDDLLIEKLARMTRGFAELVEPYRDGQWLARELAGHGLPLAIVTGGRRAEVNMVIDLFDLGDVFTAAISSDDVPDGKPDPGPFLAGAAALGADPAACVVLEDALPGLRAAQAAGMWPIVVDRRGDPARFAPTTPVERLDQHVLDMILERANRR